MRRSSLLVPALISLSLFITLWLGVRQGWWWPYDDWILTAFHTLASPNLNRIATLLSLLGSGWVITPLALAAFLWLRRSSQRKALWLAGTVVGGLLLFLAVAFLVNRPRPHLFASPVSEPTPSFPSGHAMNITIFFLTFFLLEQPHRRSIARFCGMAGLMLLVVVGTCRLYLQIHFPSDIAAGVALGAAWTFLLAYRGIYRKEP